MLAEGKQFPLGRTDYTAKTKSYLQTIPAVIYHKRKKIRDDSHDRVFLKNTDSSFQNDSSTRSFNNFDLKKFACNILTGNNYKLKTSVQALQHHIVPVSPITKSALVEQN